MSDETASYDHTYPSGDTVRVTVPRQGGYVRVDGEQIMAQPGVSTGNTLSVYPKEAAFTGGDLRDLMLARSDFPERRQTMTELEAAIWRTPGGPELRKKVEGLADGDSLAIDGAIVSRGGGCYSVRFEHDRSVHRESTASEAVGRVLF